MVTVSFLNPATRFVAKDGLITSSLLLRHNAWWREQLFQLPILFIATTYKSLQSFLAPLGLVVFPIGLLILLVGSRRVKFI